jgi:hypothetical protein
MSIRGIHETVGPGVLVGYHSFQRHTSLNSLNCLKNPIYIVPVPTRLIRRTSPWMVQCWRGLTPADPPTQSCFLPPMRSFRRASSI